MTTIRYAITLIIPLCICIIQGCATSSKSLALGGGIGAATGAILGGIADPGKNGQYRTRNVIIGSAVGGMAGMMTGALVHEHTESEKQEAFLNGKKSAQMPPPAGTPPAVSNPKVDSKWIDGKVVGNRYIEGHWEYVITEPAHWETN